ncbi:MAG: hypothetical protein M3124_04380, partial [Actinomycetota bacterium]|nr:hypothetical protein [Actinomycetota bacterium]
SRVLFGYRPEASFTQTMGWAFAAVPLIGVIGAFFDLLGGRSLVVVAMTILISVALSGLIYVASRSVDRLQERIRLEVLDTGLLRFRNVMGRVREIPLRDAQSFDIKDRRGKPRLTQRDTGDAVGFKGGSGPRRSPHFTEIHVRDAQGRRHSVTLSGAMDPKEIRKLRAAVESVSST